MAHNHNESLPTKNHWEKELEKESLKEPGFKNKFMWLNPLTHLHAMEFRGICLIFIMKFRT